jgi:Ca-activated chloride channel homolog
MSKYEFDPEDPRLSAYAFGELDGPEHADEHAQIETLLAIDERARAFVAELRATGAELESTLAGEPKLELSSSQRAAIASAAVAPARPTLRLLPSLRSYGALAAAASVVATGLVAVRVWKMNDADPNPQEGSGISESLVARADMPAEQAMLTDAGVYEQTTDSGLVDLLAKNERREALGQVRGSATEAAGSKELGLERLKVDSYRGPGDSVPPGASFEVAVVSTDPLASVGYVGGPIGAGVAPSTPGAPAPARATAADPSATPVPSVGLGVRPVGRQVAKSNSADFFQATGGSRAPAGGFFYEDRDSEGEVKRRELDAQESFNRESYAHVPENDFRLSKDDPLSTFSIDVDTASYSNVRRMLVQENRLPEPGAVRIEEMLNYFRYAYPAPEGTTPFSVTTEVGSAPWAPAHRLVRIGLRGRDIPVAERKQNNLVFLLDVSGSMNEPAKLPLVQRSLRLLVEQLDERDRVAIVVYAGSEGLALPSTSCMSKAAILCAIDNLRAGGSTNGGAGIKLAYKTARENLLKDGTNRVVLCTDGDFNVGTTSEDELVRLIEEERKSGVFLSVLGFGSGNLQDSKMEQLADKGNGNYAYVDTLEEARKVLVAEMGGTLIPIAKDVKLQIEFNPSYAQAWRLIGYENRVLAHQDFKDDTKDAGELGAGTTVTALYEVVPNGVPFEAPGVDPLRYQQPSVPTIVGASGELMYVKLRYKQPSGDMSTEISVPVGDRGLSVHEASTDFKFAASVAGFGILLRKSEHVGAAFDIGDVQRLAVEGLGEDKEGYRSEFATLVAKARTLWPQPAPERAPSGVK